MNKIEVVIADDQPLMLVGLQTWFAARPNYRVSATARTAERLLDTLEYNPADLVLVSSTIAAAGDASPHVEDFPVLRALRKRLPDTPLVVIAEHWEALVLQALREAGAAGIVGRVDEKQELERVCKRTISGATGVLSKRIAQLSEPVQPYLAGPAYRGVRLSVKPFSTED
jgi:DNA-binding NarL/FixJ family response regulator